MSPKKDILYAKRYKSRSVNMSLWMIVDSNNEQDPGYIPPGSTTPILAGMFTWGTLGR